MLATVIHGFLSSGKYIFNHGIAHSSDSGFVDNEFNSAQALGITESWDQIQLHPDLKPHWEAITRHYRRINLNHSCKVIWDMSRRHLGGHIGYEPSVFYYGKNEHQYWGDKKWLSTVNYINCRNNFIALAKELGVHVPKTVCFNRISEIDFDKLKDIGYPCYLKSTTSNIKSYRCHSKAELIQAMKQFSNTKPVQVQAEINPLSIINLQYRVTENDVIRLAAIEYVPHTLSYKAYRVPAIHKPWRTVETLAYWLKEMGMQGIFSFKVAVVKTEFGLSYSVLKCTPHFKEVTYPALISQKLDIPEWMTLKISTKFNQLDDINIQDIEFNHQTSEGVIIVNWGGITNGELTLMLAGTEAHQKILAAKLEARL